VIIYAELRRLSLERSTLTRGTRSSVEGKIIRMPANQIKI